ncbi:Coiled-coil domain-containing protein 12 [Amphibalanus amphitrite]|uniref:Coiled-coil domain-containing protein 12 n=1 Tax=Amphibalanus amphitrite TaxID=1232801 RepID=A0A6A4VR58_AMPAM|nr:Coiled-coil domain-containing protein 12 [Amphibalanus amphitrite]
MELSYLSRTPGLNTTMIGKLVLLGAIGAVLAQSSQDVAILNESRSADVSGKYDFGFASEDGTARVETAGDDGEVSGQYQYVDADGQNVVVKYTAGKNGFQDIAQLAPRKPDWDLKRDLAPRLERLERRTQRAIAELIRQRLRRDQRPDDLVDAVHAAAADGDDDDE